MNKKWVVKEANPILKQIFAQQLNVSPLLAQLLLNRGLFSLAEAAKFLYAGLSCLPDPGLLKDMDRAVERVLRAVRRREKILVYGDYDADGITGTTLLVHLLKRLGGTVEFYIPHRLREGYGLHLEPVKRAAALGFALIITVDCGISGADVVAWAKNSQGPDFIITDHHQVPARLPPALAVINPKRDDCPYPFKDLAGVGVALKLAQALLRETPAPDRPAWQDYLDLTCLGTVADLVPLLGENRLLVKHGLPRLARTGRPGLKALLNITGCPEEKLATREIGFGLAPRLNAIGRMGDAGQAVKLLLCPDPETAGEIAAELEKANQQRQEEEQRVFNEALQILAEDPRLKEAKILLLASEAFHPGVTGIVASRLAEMFYRPVMLVSLEGEQGKGSGRSIPGFHLYHALFHCRQHLLSYGGHAQAAGFTLKASELNNFRQSLSSYALANLPEDLLVPQLELDAVASLTEISEQLVKELELLIPFGAGNPEPVLGCPAATILRLREVGREGNHLKVFVKENGVFRDGIGFRLAGLVAPEITEGKTVHLAFTPVLDEYNGKARVQLELKDICPGESSLDLPLEKPATDNFPSPQKGFCPAAFASLPDFARFWFENYARFPGRIFLPIWSRSFPAASREAAASISPIPKTGGGKGGKIEDLRNLPGKLSRLANLTAGSGSAVIVVNCPYQTVALAERLDGAGSRAAFFHPSFQAENGDSLDCFRQGKLPALVTTTGSLAQIPPGSKIERLIIYHLPFDREEWRSIFRYAANAGVAEIYLLFGQADRQAMEHYLASLAPDRDCLAYLYILMQHCRAKNKSIADSLPELLNALRRRGLFWAGEHTVSIALAVFYELGLLKKDRQIYLTPAPAKKLNVRHSPTFNWGEKTKEENLRWYGHVLHAPLKEIIPG
ncbi:MAG: single-stranded-DNA-specific exonuclease RecJ [Bacillota bacterium]